MCLFTPPSEVSSLSSSANPAENQEHGFAGESCGRTAPESRDDGPLLKKVVSSSFAAASSADFTMEAAQAAVFIPVSLLVMLVLGIYLHYIK